MNDILLTDSFKYTEPKYHEEYMWKCKNWVVKMQDKLGSQQFGTLQQYRTNIAVNVSLEGVYYYR